MAEETSAASDEALKARVSEALQSLPDPETGRGLVEAGLVQGLVVRNGRAGFAIELPAPQAANAEPLRQAAEKAALSVAGIETVTAVLTAHADAPSSPQTAPASKVELSSGGGGQRNGGARPAAQAQTIVPDGVKAAIAVASGKGGVGKSTVAVNLAVAMARLGRRVGLLDADVYGPSTPTMLGITERPEVGDNDKLIPPTAFGVKVMSMGFLVEPDQAMIWRGPIIVSALTQMLRDVEWGELDLLVIDMPPGTGDVQLTVAQRVPLAGAVIVSTPQEVALADARRGIAMFEKTHAPILGVIENMAYFEAPDGTRTHIFGQGGARATAQAAGAPFLGEIPLYPDLREASDAGRPLTATSPDSAAAQVFLAIAENIGDALDAGAGPKPAPRIAFTD